METKLYLYCNHEEFTFYVSEFKFLKETIYCKECKKSDMLICVGTREELLKKFEEEVVRIKKMISGEIPKDSDYVNLNYILKLAKNNLTEVKKALAMFYERTGRY